MASSKDSFYTVTGNRKEADLRQEFKNTMDGTSTEISKSQPGLLRRFRRDSSNDLIECSCVDPVTGEAPKERRCPVCLGEGYLWDEVLIDLYHAEVNTESQRSDRESLRRPGLMNTPLRVFYIPYNVDLTQEDKLVLLVLDKSGEISQPMQRHSIYRINALNPMRLDEGRLEFWKANGFEEDNKHL